MQGLFCTVERITGRIMWGPAGQRPKPWPPERGQMTCRPPCREEQAAHTVLQWLSFYVGQDAGCHVDGALKSAMVHLQVTGISGSWFVLNASCARWDEVRGVLVQTWYRLVLCYICKLWDLAVKRDSGRSRNAVLCPFLTHVYLLSQCELWTWLLVFVSFGNGWKLGSVDPHCPPIWKEPFTSPWLWEQHFW